MDQGSTTDELTVTFWGVRGSIACGGPETARYGGDTSCLEIRAGGRLLVLDAGTGIRKMGAGMFGRGPEPRGGWDADLLLTHTHFDHICGLPFFAPFFCANSRWRVWSGHLKGLSTEAALTELMMAPLFPVPKEIFHAEVACVDFRAGETLTPRGGMIVRTHALNHPNGATGYRVEWAGKAICYLTDIEHDDGPLDAGVAEFVRGADIMIYDASYTDAEYETRRGWGHSTWAAGARLADAGGVDRYVVFHHDPSHDDDFMDAVAADVAAARSGSIVARQGLTLKA